MDSIESLRRKIETAGELRSVVRTMKALAAVNIHQYQKAVEALREYNHTIEMGLQIALMEDSKWVVKAVPAPRNQSIAVIMGSDQGMCGQFNEIIGDYARQSLSKLNGSRGRDVVMVVGNRLAALLADKSVDVREVFQLPVGVTGIAPLVEDLLIKIEELKTILGFDQVIIFFNRQISNTMFAPMEERVLPVDREWLNRLKNRRWPFRSIPTFTMEWERVFSALIREYLFVSIFRAVAESMTSENVGRLASMERAEKNIEDRIENLNLSYNQCHQLSITEELLDIVSGFEAITCKSKKSNECLL